MSSILDPNSKAHLLHLKLSVAEIKTIEMLAGNGGEMPINIAALKPLSQAVIRKMCDDGLVEVRVNSSLELNPQQRLRLTDQGRAAAQYLETLRLGPKTEVDIRPQ